MSALLLAPHNDDETLFAAYTLLRERPLVVICLRSRAQERDGIHWHHREQETKEAMQILGCEWRQLDIPDHRPDWTRLEGELRLLRLLEPTVVYAPACHFATNGHQADRVPPTGWGILQHDMVGQAAERVFGNRAEIVHYQTYTRWGGRTREGTPVPYEPDWPEHKQRALNCYRSQIEHPATASWFRDGILDEWYQ